LIYTQVAFKKVFWDKDWQAKGSKGQGHQVGAHCGKKGVAMAHVIGIGWESEGLGLDSQLLQVTYDPRLRKNYK